MTPAQSGDRGARRLDDRADSGPLRLDSADARSCSCAIAVRNEATRPGIRTPPPAPAHSPTDSASAASSRIRRQARRLPRPRPASAARRRARLFRGPRRTARRPRSAHRDDRDRYAMAARPQAQLAGRSTSATCGPVTERRPRPCRATQLHHQRLIPGRSRRRQLRAIGAVHTATFSPNVIGVAGCSSVRPA